MNIIIVDDEKEVGTFLFHLFQRQSYQVDVVTNGKAFKEKVSENDYQLALIDLKLPDVFGLDLLRYLREVRPACKGIVMTGYSTVKTAVEAIKLGAYDYIEKPFEDITYIETLVNNAIQSDFKKTKENDVRRIANRIGFVVGKSEKMQQLIQVANKFAEKNINILIEGETGTGKEVLARFIHEASERADHPFIGVNCGALTETLLESELFGHEKGAFTGATKARKGLFEIANNGTLFLDEIGEASPPIQVKLLRILETREYMRVGGEETKRTNARIIAASHVDLRKAVQEGTFREDLLYRLEVVKLSIPPLRERKEDIPCLLDYFLKQYGNEHIRFSDEAVETLKNYKWPGNIRELSNIVMRALTLAEEETVTISSNYLPTHLLHPSENKEEKNEPVKNRPIQYVDETNELEQYFLQWKNEILAALQHKELTDFHEIIQQLKELEVRVERAFVREALRRTLGNRREAAKQLNISPRKIRYVLHEKKEGIE